GLAFLTDTLASAGARRPVTATSVEPVIQGLRTHAFNNVLWPDFSAIPSPSAPVLRFRTLAEEAEQRVGDLWVTPVPVDHTVPTLAFIIHDGEVGYLSSRPTRPESRSPSTPRPPRAKRARSPSRPSPGTLRRHRAVLVGRKEDRRIGADLDAHGVADPEDMALADRGQLDPELRPAADVDLV